MLRRLSIALAALTVVACLSSDDARGLRGFNEHTESPVNYRGSIREAASHPKVTPQDREGEDKLAYVEKLLLAERFSLRQEDDEINSTSSVLPDYSHETLGVGIEPAYTDVEEESSEERLQRTRQAAEPKLNRVNPESPCPDIFSYEGVRSGKERWYGVVLLTTDAPLSGIRLVIRLNKKAQLLGNWFGEVCSKDNIEFRIWNGRKKLVPGPPHSVKFFVKFSEKEVDPPRVKSIALNGKQICRSSGVTPTVVRPIATTAKPIIRPPITTRAPATNRPNNGRPSVNPPIVTTRRPITTRPNLPANGGQNTNCGVVEVQAEPFITHGQRSSRGQWPWHVALYQVKGTDLAYICGGTLIGRNTVITAAHCVTRSYNGRAVDPETILVYLGKFHLKVWTDNGVQDKQVDEIKVHPEYNSTNFHADIAILILSTKADYTLYVKPVCLWNKNSIALKEVEGVEGTVVGWGYDERGVVTEDLMMAKMPVVSQQTCIWSYPTFFPHFTSEKTYCAGFRNGTSVCNGDSGGGMVFPKRDRPDGGERWYLRGLVSLGASQDDKRVCNTKHYVVFTDVAKYLDWIEKNTSI